jgi:hypothetical protein
MAVVLQNHRLIFRKNRYGFGYEIVSHDGNLKNQERLFHTSSRAQFDAYLATAEKDDDWNPAVDLGIPERDFTAQLLVTQEKYGEQYLLVATEADLFETALSLVKQRYKDGVYQNPANELQQEITQLEALTQQDIERFPSSLQYQLQQELRKADRLKRDLAAAVIHQQWLEKALGGDGRAAFDLLLARSDYEYERVNLRQFTVLPKFKRMRTTPQNDAN